MVVHGTQVHHHTRVAVLGCPELMEWLYTAPRYTTIPDLLTCRVCFDKHMMISTQVRHHTHLDLSTCRVCSVVIYDDNTSILLTTLVRSLLIACVWSRSLSLLVRWPVICCQDGCFMVHQRRIARRVSQSQFRRALLGRRLGLFGAFLTLVGGHH